MNDLQSASFDDVLQPVATAKGLSNKHYIDPETAKIERDKIFFANWAGLAFGKDVAERVLQNGGFRGNTTFGGSR